MPALMILPGGTIGYLVRRRDTGQLVGVVNLSEIVRGVFQSAYLGFYAHAARAGSGLISEGLRIALGQAFGRHHLHRVEANMAAAGSRAVAPAQRRHLCQVPAYLCSRAQKVRSWRVT